MKKLVLLVLYLSVFMVSPALAQTSENIIISPRSIVVNPYATSAYNVEVFLNRDPSGDLVPTYNIGDLVTINVRPTQDSYIYVFNVRSNGEVSQLIPNRFNGGSDNYVLANTLRTFPAQNSGFRFNIDAPIGLEKVIAVASKRQLNVTELASFQNDPNFASSNIGEQGFARTLSIILNPISNTDWVTDTLLFNVVDNTPPPPPIYGTLNIQCNVDGVAVYVDGFFRGYTVAGQVMSMGDVAGTHTVRIASNGYNVFEQAVNVVAGQTTSINATLSPTVRRGTVDFDSNPRGATVYVNGQNLGTTPVYSVSYNVGTYTAVYRLAGYADTTQQFTVVANQDSTLSASMAPISGSVLIRSAINSRIFIDGKDYGIVNAGIARSITNLPERYYEIIAVAEGYNAYHEEIYVSSGTTMTIDLNHSRR